MRHWDDSSGLGESNAVEKRSDDKVGENESLTYIVSNNVAKVLCVSLTAAIGDYVLPSSLGACPVIEIGSFAFHSCTGLTSVAIPKDVTHFGYGVFEGCSGLTNFCVDVDNSDYRAIGGMLISKDGCLIAVGGGVSGVTIPEGVSSIGDGAFGCCRKFSSMIIPDGVMSVGGAAFHDCVKLTRLEIPDSVIAIGASAFSRCLELREVRVSAKSKNRISMLLKKAGVDVRNLKFVEKKE